MQVFRLCRQDEIKKILTQKSFADVGQIYQNNHELNSHNYRANVKYLHFFKNKIDLLYLNTTAGRFICTYDIPEKLLNESAGQGKYKDYIAFKTLCQVDEYAIPVNNLKYEHLLAVKQIIKTFDFEDIHENPSEYFQTIYQREKTDARTL